MAYHHFKGYSNMQSSESWYPQQKATKVGKYIVSVFPASTSTLSGQFQSFCELLRG